MPSQSRGQLRSGLQSKSTPNLPTLHSLASGSDRSLTSSTQSSTAFDRGSILQAREPHDSVLQNDRSSLHEPTYIESVAFDSLSNDSASDDDGDDDAPISNLPLRRPLYTHHSRSHSHLLEKPSAPFAPPFYTRPPTPQPPSPSLTLLLRPSFTSRPTTPDSSDHEGTTSSSLHPGGIGAAGTHGTATPASSTTTAAFVSKSASLAPAYGVPRAHPKVPTYEYYGFVLYLCSSAAFIVYILWAYLPSPFLHQLGIYYYPNRWWALAIPAWLVMALGFVYVVLACWNTEVLTLPMESCEGLIDDAANVAVIDASGHIIRKDKAGQLRSPTKSRSAKIGPHRRQSLGESGNDKSRKDGTGGLAWRMLWNEGTDAVMDVPIGGVCEILYGDGRAELENGVGT